LGKANKEHDVIYATAVFAQLPSPSNYNTSICMGLWIHRNVYVYTRGRDVNGAYEYAIFREWASWWPFDPGVANENRELSTGYIKMWNTRETCISAYATRWNCNVCRKGLSSDVWKRFSLEVFDVGLQTTT